MMTTTLRLAALVVLCGLVAAPARLGAAAGYRPAPQAEAWAEAVNLSHSGGAANPRLVIDASGTRHVLWDDVYAGVVYARGTDAEWSVPEPVDLPFAGLDVELLADSTGGIHAFWLDEDRNLVHQSVSANGLANPGSWQPLNTLAASVANFDVALDSANRLHLAYIRLAETADFPAGVYELQSDAVGINWSQPEPIALSPYFRTLIPPPGASGVVPAGRLPLAHIDIELATVEDSTHTYVTWDQPALQRVYLALRLDAGASWSSPQEIDAPDAAEPYKEPRRLMVSANGRELVLFWQVAMAGGSCTTAYQASPDGGATWDRGGRLLVGLEGCPEAWELLRQPDGNPLLLAQLASRSYLVAWGNGWSLPQPQAALDNAFDPATYTFVELGCLSAAIYQDNLFAVACDETGNGDIWYSARALGPLEAWFSPAVGWAQAEALNVGPDEVAALTLSEQAGAGFSALWAHSGNPAVTTFYQARWQADGAVGPFPVLEARGGLVGEVASLADGAGRLWLFWADAAASVVNYSWVDAQQAANATSWSRVAALPSPAPLVAAPQAVVAGGEVKVLFAVPLNEGRGVYLVRSADRGVTWSPPGVVFAGSEAECSFIQAPRLTAADTGALYATWACASPLGAQGPAALYLSASSDGGATWSPPERWAEGQVTWSELVAVGPQTLHQVWQEGDPAGAVTWHRVSDDGGETWSRPESVALGVGTVGASRLAVDSAGGLSLLQVVQPAEGGAEILYWYWDGQAWSTREALPVGAVLDPARVVLDALVDSEGRLVTVYTKPARPEAAGQSAYELVMASRSLGIDPASPPPQPTAAATAAPVLPTLEGAALTATPEGAAPAASPTPPLADIEDEGGQNDLTTNGILIGVVGAAVLILGVGVASALRGRRPS